ncbi:peptide methionine sulfoxide reductase MsrA 2 [Abditibacteriota bacterium]|nr:peptide methionine sulfoxide reductase MsrA 2 [Abditibacteriota bacterium]
MKAFKSFVPLYIVAVLGVGALVTHSLKPTTAYAKSTKIAAPKVAKSGQQTATFAAGCFWSMEAIFKQLKGVASVEPGYAGGKLKNPTYEQVEEANTGHAETINIIFDPKVITYRDLLQVLLTVRDPTTLNRQGPDEGPQYRSVIFARNAEQKQQAQDAIKQIGAEHLWNAPIVTQVASYSNFYRAEDYHLNYYNLHPNEGYCAGVIAPEIAEFRTKFKDKLK